MNAYEVIFYTTPRGDNTTSEFISDFPVKVQGKILKLINRLEEYGPGLTRPYADPLRDKIRELIINFGNLDIRLLYFFNDKKVIITHGFCKKTRTTPDSEIDRAIYCMKEYFKHGGK